MSLCIVNFLPSVDDFWVFGNAIYKDYYVTHKPEDAILGFTPTEKQRKDPLYKANQPVAKLALGYDWWMFLAKFVASACIGVGTWVVMKYVFNTTTIAFLDKGEIASEQAKKAIANKIQQLDASELADLITKIQDKNSTASSSSNAIN